MQVPGSCQKELCFQPDRAAVRRLLAALGCLLVALLAAPANADIVWEGRTVAAWPEGAYDAEPPAPAPGQQWATKFYPSPKGVVWGLTILVDFSDQAPAFPKPDIEAWLNQRNYTGGGNNGSIRDYYWDVSNGQVDFQNDVVGFYRAKKPKSYYEGGSGYARSDELFAEVIAAMDPMVDFAKYDNDKNGRTDAISLVYAGEGVTWGQGLWPHASGSSTRADGVVLSRYMMSALGRRLTIYTFAHEVGHMLFGWPDLYGFGDYCLMGNASNPVNPAGINDFFRADQGWIPEIDISSTTNANAIASVNGGGYRYTNPADPGECFFWSNIQNQGRWKVLRGSGLLFMHYKRSIRSNNPPNPLALAVVQADGRDDLGKVQWPSPGSDAKDFFFGGGVSEFSDSTTPNAQWMDKSSSGLRVYGITANGMEMRFSVGKQAPSGEVLRPDGGVIVDAGTPPGAGSDAGATSTPDAGSDAGAGPRQPIDAAAPMEAGTAAGPDRDAGQSASADTGAAPSTDAAVGPVALGGDAQVSVPGDEASSDQEGCALRTPGARDAAGLGVWLLALLGSALLWRRRR
jgi:M6 family metalloprotease-like protein